MSAASLSSSFLANDAIMCEPNFVPFGERIPQALEMWNNNLYSIVFGALSVPAAKLGERFGLIKMNRIGISGFTLMSVLCGLSRMISYQKTGIKYGGFYFLLAFRCL